MENQKCSRLEEKLLILEVNLYVNHKISRSLENILQITINLTTHKALKNKVAFKTDAKKIYHRILFWKKDMNEICTGYMRCLNTIYIN